MPEKNASKAASPPAEAPIPTIGKSALSIVSDLVIILFALISWVFVGSLGDVEDLVASFL